MDLSGSSAHSRSRRASSVGDTLLGTAHSSADNLRCMREGKARLHAYPDTSDLQLRRATCCALPNRTGSANIFHLAGIDLVSVHCGVSPNETEKLAACDRVLAEHVPSIAVSLIPESMTSGLPHPIEAFAVAIPSTVFVFFERIHQAAERASAKEPQMLGAVLAHELGHELLGGSSHSPWGVMKSILRTSDFEVADKGRLRFSSAEEERLRKSLKKSK
jgi:hypothetical protein